MLFFKLQCLYSGFIFENWHVYKHIDWHLEHKNVELILFNIIYYILNTMYIYIICMLMCIKNSEKCIYKYTNLLYI